MDIERMRAQCLIVPLLPFQLCGSEYNQGIVAHQLIIQLSLCE